MESTRHPIIQQALDSIKFFSKIKYVFVLKDHNLRILAMTDFAAYVFGVADLTNVIGKTVMEVAYDKHPKMSKQIAQLDEYLINSDLESLSSISFFNYADGVQARLVIRYKLVDPETKAFLGILYQEIPSGIDNKCATIMDSLGEQQFASLEFPDLSPNSTIEKLTQYEHEICFLITIGWGLSQIHKFLERLYPEKSRTLDAVIKKKNAICYKFNIENNHIETLRRFLLKHNVYRKIPESLLTHLVGAYLIQ